MHEASLCDALFDQVDRALVAHRGARVRVIRVALGELAGVDPELFRLAFDALRVDRHPGAELDLTLVPATWRCPTCRAERAPDAPLACPTCQTPLALEAGGDLTLERLELEVRSPHTEVHDV